MLSRNWSSTTDLEVGKKSLKKFKISKLQKSPMNRHNSKEQNIANKEASPIIECHESPIPQCQAQAPQNTTDESDSDITSIQQNFESIYTDKEVIKVEISRTQDQRGVPKGYIPIKKKNFKRKEGHKNGINVKHNNSSMKKRKRTRSKSKRRGSTSKRRWKASKDINKYSFNQPSNNHKSSSSPSKDINSADKKGRSSFCATNYSQSAIKIK